MVSTHTFFPPPFIKYLYFSCRKFQILSWLWFTLCSLVLLACGGNVGNKKFYEGTGGIEGHILDTDGKTVANATISIVDYPSLHTTSTQSGFFQLTGIPSGRRDILLDNRLGLAARITVWVVKDHITEISTSQSTLLPTAVLSGRVVAPPRLDDKGISVSLSGTPYQTITYNDLGDFRFEQIPAGCHSLAAETPLFSTQHIDVICIKPGEHRSLERPLQLYPTISCQHLTDCSSTSITSICHEGACVPEGRGKIKPTVSSISFVNVPFQESSTQIYSILQNVGYGPLVIHQIQIEGGEGAFALEKNKLPTLPIYLPIRQSLALSLTFRANQVRHHQAFLLVTSDDKETPILKIPLEGTVKTQETDCLVFEPQSLATESSSRQISISVSIFNRCGQAIAVNPPHSRSSPFQGDSLPVHASCTSQTWGEFNIPTCQSSSSQHAISVGPGEKRSWIWDLQVFGYGFLEGHLTFSYTERHQGQDTPKTVSIPVQTRIGLPGLTVSPQILDFGSVAPAQTVNLWLALRFSPITSLDLLEAQFLSASSVFQVTGTRWSRHVPQSNTHYLQVMYTAPLSRDQYQNTLILKNHPFFQGLPYYLRVQGSVANTTTPTLPSSLHLGHTAFCQAPFRPVYITNPGDKPITVQEITLASIEPDEFAIKQGAYPFTVPAQSTVQLAQIQWRNTDRTQSVRALGQLQIKTRREDRYTLLTSQLVAHSGFPHVDTHIQPPHRRINILLFVDHKSEQTDFITRWVDLLQKMQAEQFTFSMHPVTSTSEHDLPPITQNTTSVATELQHWLQLVPTTSLHQGLTSLQMARKKLSLPNPTSTSIAVFFSEHDDLSPYSIESYLPTSSSPSEVFHVFAAIPKQTCSLLSKAVRYVDLVSQTAGVSMDLCQPQPAAWKSWFQQMEDLIFQRRKRFPLRYQPEESSIKVKIDGVYQNNDDPPQFQKWQYDPSTNQIILTETQLPPSKKLEISYYTSCQ